MVGAGLHTTQTVGLALATDLAPPEARPRVVALMYVVLLLGMVVSSIAFGALLAHFSEMRLIQVVQGAALLTMVLNGAALWKQEPRRPASAADSEPQPASRLVAHLYRAVLARSAFSWRWASGLRRSACRTSCWSPMEDRYCTSP